MQLTEIDCNFKNLIGDDFYLLDDNDLSYHSYYLYKRHGGTLYEKEIEDLYSFHLERFMDIINDVDISNRYKSTDSELDFDSYKSHGWKLYRVGGKRPKFYLDI